MFVPVILLHNKNLQIIKHIQKLFYVFTKYTQMNTDIYTKNIIKD